MSTASSRFGRDRRVVRHRDPGRLLAVAAKDGYGEMAIAGFNSLLRSLPSAGSRRMNQENRAERRAQAAAQLTQREGRGDAARIAGSLDDGLNLLCDLFYTRIHVDVEKNFGMDSMLIPVSPIKSEENAKLEIRLYQVVEAAAAAKNRQYFKSSDEEFLDWLAELQLGELRHVPTAVQRLGQYTQRSQDRRRVFANALQRALPEAARAPLVVYRLLPMAVAIVTAVGFLDPVSAQEVRRKQIALLPGIGDCHQCHGAVLENGDRCSLCVNPLWKYEWLTAE
jgi:hypothetical protein